MQDRFKFRIAAFEHESGSKDWVFINPKSFDNHP